MKSLLLEHLQRRVVTHESVQDLFARVDAGEYPIDCSELEQPLTALMVAATATRSGLRAAKTPGARQPRCLVVTPSDAEAEAFASDCLACGDRKSVV